MYKYAFLCLLFISAAAFSQSRLTTRLDSLFRACPSGEPGFAVSIEKKGFVLYRNVTGLADRTTGTPLDTASNFRMASVTKQFTAMGIFLLEKAGVLSFDDPLSRWLPELPSRIGHTVLIRHLLTHTSGLLDYEGLIPDSQTRRSWMPMCCSC